MSELDILQAQGNQTIPDLRAVQLPNTFRGRPVLSDECSNAEKKELADLCPTGAICADPFSLNLAKCVFCKECALRFPEKIKFTNDYRMAVNDLHSLIITPGVEQLRLNPERKRPEVRKLFGRSLKLRQVSAGGDNATEMELNACGNVNFDMGRYGIEFVASPRHADGIVITGPISKHMAQALETCYAAVPEPKIVVLAGTDAISGGLFAESSEVERSFLSRYPIDLYVPGNPSHPLAVINGLLDLINRDGLIPGAK